LLHHRLLLLLLSPLLLLLARPPSPAASAAAASTWLQPTRQLPQLQALDSGAALLLLLATGAAKRY
jgi:hypothetical protein